MSKKTSTTMRRCQEGWRLFFRIGDIYTSITNLHPEDQDWGKHAEAVEEHKEHIEGCENCRKGRKETQMILEEMKVENGTAIS